MQKAFLLLFLVSICFSSYAQQPWLTENTNQTFVSPAYNPTDGFYIQGMISTPQNQVWMTTTSVGHQVLYKDKGTWYNAGFPDSVTVELISSSDSGKRIWVSYDGTGQGLMYKSIDSAQWHIVRIKNGAKYTGVSIINLVNDETGNDAWIIFGRLPYNGAQTSYYIKKLNTADTTEYFLSNSGSFYSYRDMRIKGDTADLVANYSCGSCTSFSDILQVNLSTGVARLKGLQGAKFGKIRMVNKLLFDKQNDLYFYGATEDGSNDFHYKWYKLLADTTSQANFPALVYRNNTGSVGNAGAYAYKDNIYVIDVTLNNTPGYIYNVSTGKTYSFTYPSQSEYNNSGSYPFFTLDNELVLPEYLIRNGSNIFFYYLFPTATNVITGSIYADINHSGTFDVNEGVPNLVTHLNPNTIYAASDATGAFTYELSDTSGSYTVQLDNMLTHWKAGSPTSLNVSQTYAGQFSDSLSFRLIPADSGSDMVVNTYVRQARPGFYTDNVVTIKNSGTVAFSGTLVVTVDSLFSKIKLLDYGTLNNYVATYSISIQPLQTQQFNITGLLSNKAVRGDSIHLKANIFNATDLDSSDNRSVFSREIKGSYDPNAKEVVTSPSKKYYMPGDTLTYRIDFQNTGTDTALNVVVTDSIDVSKLDISTIHLLTYTGNCVLQMGDNGKVAFSFFHILLPDSNASEVTSHGFVTFSIRVRSDDQNGDTINNNANIYFDYNAPVQTNTASVVLGLNIATLTMGNTGGNDPLMVYPDPTKGLITLMSPVEERREITVMNLLGKAVLAKTDFTPSRRSNLDLSGLSAGIYFIRVNAESGVAVKKIIKQ